MACARCPRLREHCAAVARVKRASYRGWDYWGRPLPNLGEPDAALLVVGLAPAAHGGNRTGRAFTGDRSGDFLYRAMHAAGLANQPHSVHRDDGLRLIGAAITAAAHCAPPDNKPTPAELGACSSHLLDTAGLMPNLRVCLALGRIAFDACVRLYRAIGWDAMRPAPRFAHAAVYRFPAAPTLIGSYHPSQQNTFTGRLTQQRLIDVFVHANAEADMIAVRMLTR